MIQRKIRGNSLEPIDRVLFSVGPFKEGFPTAVPIQSGRRPLEPHCVSICEPEKRKQRRECVSYDLRQEVRDLNDINWLREQSREPRSAEIIEHWNDLGWLKARYKRDWDEEIAEVSIFEEGREWDEEMGPYFEAIEILLGRPCSIGISRRDTWRQDFPHVFCDRR